MKFVLDENFGLSWVGVFEAAGWEAVPWIRVGRRSAEDDEIMQWARDNGAIVVTKDLDFGYMLYMTRAEKPSVVMVRCVDPRPEVIAKDLVWAIERSSFMLDLGALLVFDDNKHRVRVLPLG